MQNYLIKLLGEPLGRRVSMLAALSSVFLLLMLVILVLDANKAIFYFLNGLSVHTGTALWANLTMLGEGLVVLALVGLVAIRWPAAAWAMLIGAIVGSIIVHGLKGLIGELRPAMVLPQGSFNIIGPKLSYESFPSGHTATIAGFAAILFLYSRHAWGAVALLVLAVLVGISRSVVGAHWPLDILAGWVVGMVYGVISVVLAERWTRGLKVPVQTGIILLSVLCAIALFVLEPYMPEARRMEEALVLRWLIAGIGLVSGVWALFLLHRPVGIEQK